MESIKPTMFEPAAANIVAGWVTEGKAQLCKEKKDICSAFAIGWSCLTEIHLRY